MLLPVSVMSTLGASCNYTQIVFAILSLCFSLLNVLPGFDICLGIESPPSSGMIFHHDFFFHSLIDGHLGCFRGRTLL